MHGGQTECWSSGPENSATRTTVNTLPNIIGGDRIKTNVPTTCTPCVTRPSRILLLAAPIRRHEGWQSCSCLIACPRSLQGEGQTPARCPHDGKPRCAQSLGCSGNTCPHIHQSPPKCFHPLVTVTQSMPLIEIKHDAHHCLPNSSHRVTGPR